MSQKIPNTFIQEVLARNDIVEVVRTRLQLNQRGNSHLARCPFHEEKTPSFNVIQHKQFYYCFGCGAHGNAIGFLMAFDHLEFREAVQELANRVGLEIPDPQKNQEQQQFDYLHQVLDQAASYYQLCLRKNLTAIEYLKARGLTGQTAKLFGLGYSPDEWQGLQQFLNAKQIKLTDQINSGLIINKDTGKSYDRFRKRIIFPIRDVHGKMIGFGGRTLGDDQPKYLNSPETPLFHKGSELYGLYESRQANHKLNQLLIVEGYMDVISLHQQGIKFAVASLGTAITAKQIQKCLRYVSHCVFCFDGDPAGRQAAWKALLIALPLMREGIHIHFLFLPEKEDPDSLVRKIGGAAFSQLIEQSPPLTEVFFQELKARIPTHSIADKAQYGQQAAQYINTMPQGLFRQLMYEQCAQELQIDTNKLHDLLQPPSPKASTTRQALTKPLETKKIFSPMINQAIALLLFEPNLSKGTPDLSEIELLDIPGKKLFFQILEFLRQKPDISTGELMALIEKPEEQELLAQLSIRRWNIPPAGIQEEFLGVLVSLKQQALQHNIDQLIEKAKKNQLNIEEKLKLQSLLAKIKKDASER